MSDPIDWEGLGQQMSKAHTQEPSAIAFDNLYAWCVAAGNAFNRGNSVLHLALKISAKKFDTYYEFYIRCGIGSASVSRHGDHLTVTYYDEPSGVWTGMTMIEKNELDLCLQSRANDIILRVLGKI